MNTHSHRQIWDISPPLNANTPAFPGDTPLSLTWALRISADCPVNVGCLTLSPHLGAHADAPLHYDPAGAAVGALDLLPFLGRCRVVHAIQAEGVAGRSVSWAEIAPALVGKAKSDTERLPERVLIRTYRNAPTQHWDPNMCALAPEVIDELAARDVLLVGIDTASIDPPESKTLESHQRIRSHGIRVLENLVLDDVPAGDYELIALPLKLMDADASPVRAILRNL